ncbi:unnamed protein product, partial [Ixodes persulcatus]
GQRRLPGARPAPPRRQATGVPAAVEARPWQPPAAATRGPRRGRRGQAQEETSMPVLETPVPAFFVLVCLVLVQEQVRRHPRPAGGSSPRGRSQRPRLHTVHKIQTRLEERRDPTRSRSSKQRQQTSPSSRSGPSGLRAAVYDRLTQLRAARAQH